MRTTQCYACGRYYVDVTSHSCSGASPQPVATGSPPLGMPPAAARKKLKWYYDSRSSMDTDSDASLVPQADRQKWDTALANFMFYATGDDVRELFTSSDAPIGNLTLADFVQLKPYERIAIINRLWNRIAIWVKPNKKAKDMFEPFPTDPVHFTSSHGNRVSGAWKRFGIGFRSETLADLQRILDFGIQPLYKSVNIAEGLGHKIKGTIMDTAVRRGEMALWKKNQDAVGNTAICVSRNLKGATKFPDQQYSGIICAFAVRPSKTGFDTETWQKSLGETAIWRPGEKLFPGIDKADIIGYTQVQKSAGSLDDDARSWGFEFLQDNWTFLGGNSEEREYLNGELRAMRAMAGRTTWVAKKDDFYKN